VSAQAQNVERDRFYDACKALVALPTRLMTALRVYDRPDPDDLRGGMLVASNHCSFLDPMVVGVALPVRVEYLARSTLFDPPGFGRLIHRLGAHPVRRGQADAGALRTMIQVLRNGGKLVMFPEGTRSRTGQMGRLRPGAASVACRCGVPVLPVYVHGTYEAWPRHALLPRPARVTVAFGRPIDTTGRDAQTVTDELGERLRERRDFLRSRPSESGEHE
jgi:1-acyl-sn-glycerol-3-phosphate acyltransferase